ncbi:MAG TPA: hypothetical protein VLG47_00585 [Candidatus Saccharimonadales bacterium]|nr:hypothetical protein [Candidatus Saccharimonadales bacterium]
MRKFWSSIHPDEENVFPILRRSHGPLNNAAGLEIQQFGYYDIRYHGSRDIGGHDEKSWHDPKLIKPSIYAELRNGRIGLIDLIEDLPDKKYGTIGNVPLGMPGPRIGCPILLTPQLLQRFWEAYIDSIAHFLGP